jgi:transforming growth factor-beta-induced protein
MKINSLSKIVLASSLMLVACGESENRSTKETDQPTKVDRKVADTVKSAPTLAEIAASTPDLSILASLVGLCELGGALSDTSASLTVFAPTNAAFAKLLAGAPAPTTCDTNLKNTLLYHVLGQKVVAGDLAAQQAVPSLLDAKDELFVTKGEGVKVNGSSAVVAADVMASNGVAHVVDTVLIPDAQGTVVDAAAKRFDFSNLVGAVVAAGLAETLASANGITVFAPNNAAFEKLSAVPSGEALVKVLTHHVVPAAVMAKDLQFGFQSVSTLNGTSISINLSNSGAFIWGSGQTEAQAGKIIATDIVTKNGIIHAVSDVLIPSNL